MTKSLDAFIKHKKSIDKFILDPCCGPRSMWVDKKHPNVIYGDIRKRRKGFSRFEKWVEIKPDIRIDFRNLPFDDNSFRLVVFDPPHLVKKYTENHALLAKYGNLEPKTWRMDLKKGFDECWRVLDEYGTLIFKWNDSSKSYQEILKIFGKQPLFHHPLGNKKNVTYWACFMKIPEKYDSQTRLEGLIE